MTQQRARRNDVENSKRHNNNSYEHSSVKIFKSTESPTLTSRGECCLVRFLEEDYRLIRTMLGDEGGTEVKPLNDAHPVIRKACLWGDADQRLSCQDDLHSILVQRAKHLELSQGTCS